MSEVDELHALLLSLTGITEGYTSTADLWDAYLRVEGYEVGSVLDRQAQLAAVFGVTLADLQAGRFP